MNEKLLTVVCTASLSGTSAPVHANKASFQWCRTRTQLTRCTTMPGICHGRMVLWVIFISGMATTCFQNSEHKIFFLLSREVLTAIESNDCLLFQIMHSNDIIYMKTFLLLQLNVFLFIYVHYLRTYILMNFVKIS